jgi:hypothetical protein
MNAEIDIGRMQSEKTRKNQSTVMLLPSIGTIKSMKITNMKNAQIKSITNAAWKALFLLTLIVKLDVFIANFSLLYQ